MDFKTNERTIFLRKRLDKLLRAHYDAQGDLEKKAAITKKIKKYNKKMMAHFLSISAHIGTGDAV